MCVDKIDANFDLHNSFVLAMFSRILFVALTLVCRRCFSAVLIIFLALSVLKVDFSLILARNIQESIYIRVNNPTLINNIGKFNLPHIWDRVLLNTKSLNLKRQVNNNNNTQPN